MNIGFDVDGVLVDMAGYQLKYGEEYFRKKHLPVRNPSAFDIKDIFECSSEEREKFWIRYIWKYCLREPMTSGASQLSHKLKEDGHKVTIVTARAHTTEKGLTGRVFRRMLQHWLKKNDFVYDEIYYCSESDSPKDKTDICINHVVDVLIDDKPENLLSLMGKINIICYPACWNEGIEPLDPYRVKNMEMVYSRIRELSARSSNYDP